MDDLEFRRALYADPDSQDSKLIDAAKQDPTKAQALKEARQFNETLKSAAKVSAPEGLKARLLLKQSMQEERRQQSYRRHTWMAMAACFALVSLLSFNFLKPEPINLGEHAISHIAHEGVSPFNIEQPMALQTVNAKLARLNSQLTSDVSKVYYASFCLFKKVPSMHLVMDAPGGKVTVFIIPHDEAQLLPDHFEDGEFKGVGEDLGYANLVVVGNRDQDLTSTVQTLSDSLRTI